VSGPERVMVCMSSSVDAPRLVRRGELMAAGLGARLYAVYVETAKEHPDRITPRDRDTLARNMALAQSLGATVVRVKAARTVDGLIEFARREGITHVIVGQTQRSRWEILQRLPTQNASRGDVIRFGHGHDQYEFRFTRTGTAPPARWLMERSDVTHHRNHVTRTHN
jgi:K+-sensing histidine kinase KdpD